MQLTLAEGAPAGHSNVLARVPDRVVADQTNGSDILLERHFLGQGQQCYVRVL